jgi:hypothetical protein
MKVPGFGGLLALFVAGALLIGTPLVDTAAARPRPQPAWHLVDYAQRACFDAHVTDSYFGVWINGRWNRAIDVGARRLQPGGGYSTSYAPIAPGSSSGVYSLAYVHVTVTPTTPIGVYTASLWASDGSTSQAVPIILDVRATCGY